LFEQKALREIVLPVWRLTMPEKLPEGWIKTNLGEIVTPSRERARPMELPETRYVGLEHVESNTMKLLGSGIARDVRSSSFRFAKGDVLYAKMRPYLNKVWVAEFDGICSPEFLVFKMSEVLNTRFLAIRLNAEDFVSFANGQVSGERPRAAFDKLARFPILWPPLDEQERIVTKLDAALSSVDRASAASRRAQKRLGRYRTAVLDAAVIGELTRTWRETQSKSQRVSDEPSAILAERLLGARRTRWEESELHRLRMIGEKFRDEKWKLRYRQPGISQFEDLPAQPERWTWISIDQLSWDSGYGTSVKCTYEGQGPAVLRIPNIRDRKISFEDLKFASSAGGFRDEDFVSPGDLLLVRTNGSRDLLGRAAIVRRAPPRKCGFASYLIRFRLVGGETVWSWVSLAWDSNFLRSNIESRAATTAGQYNVSISRLKDLPIPLPPVDEQVQIVSEVQRRLQAADRLEAALDQQLLRAKSTRHSLLEEAFLGRLVAQDNRDEPASLLLKRIQAARIIAAQKPKGRYMAKFVPHSERRSLLDVLRENKKPMTPEQLFSLSGYQEEFESNECRQEVVDHFYEELRQLVNPKGPVQERRVKPDRVLLEVKS
jgi:type I restriction enzyme, S subunit